MTHSTTHKSPRFAGLAQARGELRWRLCVVSSPDPFINGLHVDLPAGPAVLGREPGGVPGEISVQDAAMSRQHAALAPVDGGEGVLVRDLGSSNGSFVDGRRCVEVAVGPGAVLRLGDTLLVLDLRGPDGTPSDADVPGSSSTAAAIRGAVRRAAADAMPALITGPTGTGKERVAAAIHRRSGRPGPLVRVNVTAIPSGLFESEFFGHVQGAFSGATGRRQGRAREASGGTLVLDELGDLPMSLQPKLLRLIEEGVVRPVGGSRDERVDVKFVASTNADLDVLVQRGDFRRDLLARLRHHVVTLPPLAGRRGDLLELADALLPQTDVGGRPIRWADLLHVDAVEALLLHGWPDNLRGLRRVLASLAARPPGPISVAALPEELLSTLRELQRPETGASPPPPPRRGRPDEASLRRLIARCKGNLEAVARELGRDRRQVYRWLKAYGISLREVERLRDGDPGQR